MCKNASEVGGPRPCGALQVKLRNLNCILRALGSDQRALGNGATLDLSFKNMQFLIRESWGLFKRFPLFF